MTPQILRRHRIKTPWIHPNFIPLVAGFSCNNGTVVVPGPCKMTNRFYLKYSKIKKSRSEVSCFIYNLKYCFVYKYKRVNRKFFWIVDSLTSHVTYTPISVYLVCQFNTGRDGLLLRDSNCDLYEAIGFSGRVQRYEFHSKTFRK